MNIKTGTKISIVMDERQLRNCMGYTAFQQRQSLIYARSSQHISSMLWTYVTPLATFSYHTSCKSDDIPIFTNCQLHILRMS